MWWSHLISHSFPVLVSHSLQVSLPASQPTKSAAGGEPCGEPAISLHSHHVSLVQWTTCLLPVTRDPGSNLLGGYLCETGILLLALSRYSGDPHQVVPFVLYTVPLYTPTHTHTSAATGAGRSLFSLRKWNFHSTPQCTLHWLQLSKRFSLRIPPRNPHIFLFRFLSVGSRP